MQPIFCAYPDCSEIALFKGCRWCRDTILRCGFHDTEHRNLVHKSKYTSNPTGKKCGACYQYGHTRRSQICPLYLAEFS